MTTDPSFWQIAAQPIATLFAGLGAITAGALAFMNGQRHRQQDALHYRETSIRESEARLRDRYTTAVSQLADESAAIREGGVYALASLLDDWGRLGWSRVDISRARPRGKFA
ncbi:MAG: hypothetical protein JHC70_15630 [Rhodococcus sp.]|nr:hypothetical protein [Rhodococcus sp. (in: high G+C Gram-positive bacteria)]MBJ7323759.1 hypothetical protein [Rhodococcus sp. (in: high G+C Gram-positive bacteria)]